jgi:2-oxoglutarate dehydrogenase E2 component (dihydrolipoamide succinyltransferase)
MSTIEIRVPQLPESVADATLVEWRKQPGDAVRRDENLAISRPTRSCSRCRHPAGVLLELKVRPAPPSRAGNCSRSSRGAGAASRRRPREPAVRQPRFRRRLRSQPRPWRRATRRPATQPAPSVRRLVEEHKLEPSPSRLGRDGRITKGDVLSHLADKGGPAAAGTSTTPVAAATAVARPAGGAGGARGERACR